ncbi:hypothetical protein N478_03540 [Pseudoalteromonas luteoviolacea S4060-1]|uniref:Lipoprotein n=1 Tax=Pseudoalteromonas luteoviolacea S4060-1 TaxID=1365257 RepID=A0A162BK97_9GAMM|nr:hypothetical protein N478_03540 [Pseudoalteromonas luteoviolacea S4060-1]
MKKVLIICSVMTLSGCFSEILNPSKEAIEAAIKSCKNVNGTYQLAFDMFTCKFGENEIRTHVTAFPTLNQ